MTAQTMNAAQIRQVIAPAISFAGRSAAELDALATRLATRYGVEIQAATREGVVEQLAEILRTEGFFVSPSKSWEKLGDFLRRMAMSYDALYRILKAPLCPAVDLHRANGGKGRINAISANEIFESFCRASCAPHKREKKSRPSRAKPEDQLQRRRMNGPRRSYI